MSEVDDFIKVAAEASHYLTAALAGGLLAGGAGGILASRGGNRLGEDDDERRKRIISNALAMGTLGAVAGAGGVGAYDAFSHAAPPRGKMEEFLLGVSPTKRTVLGATAGAAASVPVQISTHAAGTWLDKQKLERIANDHVAAMANAAGVPIKRDGALGWIQDLAANPGNLSPQHLAKAQLAGEKALQKFRQGAATTKSKALGALAMKSRFGGWGTGLMSAAGGLIGYFAPDLTGVWKENQQNNAPQSN